MIAWVLIIWIGDHQGYLTVPDIRDQAECEALYQAFTHDPVGYSYAQHSCLSYRKAGS